ncbi:MFS transporter [Streptomyces avidinii]|uniref:MFS family permease n=1 Tax=Streptomyces avidinii TaxID=1895 RepID=A0ABS4LHC5_STRAV|nr:MFS transporter [Streptomyces avidinii]MBP2041433.1 MFS family permease [Streptomyces avidinii]GGY84647.1 MFS transporter [Streptomyces avidinii]
MAVFMGKTAGSEEAKVAGERSLLLGIGISAVGIGMYIPFSLVFFHHVTGLSLTLVGLVMTVTGLAGLAFMPLAGSAVDRFGAKRVNLVLYGMRALGFALYPFASSLPAFAAVALVTALADRSFGVVQQSLIGEVARGAARDRLQASTRALQNAGMGAGALLVSGVLALWGTGGFTYTAWGNALAFALAGLLVSRVRADRTAGVGGAAGAAASGSVGYRTVLRDRPFLGLTAANFLTALGYSALSVLFPLYLSTWLKAPDSLTGAAFTVNTVLCAGVGVLIAGRVRRSGARRTRSAALGALLFAAAFVGQIALGTLRPGRTVTLVALLAIVVVYTLGELVHSPSGGALSVSAAPEPVRGRYLATYQLSYSLAGALAPSLFTALLAVDGRLPWAVLAVAALGAALALLRLERHLPAEAVHAEPPVAVRAASAPHAAPSATPAAAPVDVTAA